MGSDFALWWPYFISCHFGMETALSVSSSPPRTVWSEPVRIVCAVSCSLQTPRALTGPSPLFLPDPPLIGQHVRGSPTPPARCLDNEAALRAVIGSRPFKAFILGQTPRNVHEHAQKWSCKRSACTFQHQYLVDSSQRKRGGFAQFIVINRRLCGLRHHLTAAVAEKLYCLVRVGSGRYPAAQLRLCLPQPAGRSCCIFRSCGWKLRYFRFACVEFARAWFV